MRTFFLIPMFSVLALWRAGAVTPQEAEFFEKRVRPVLADHCYKCHGAEKQKAELRLDSRAAVLKGTDLGPVVVAGKPEESSLIKSIRHVGDSKMPEKADKLPDEHIEALSEWVKLGMPWPDDGQPVATNAREDLAKTHWSFQPVRAPAVPAPADAEKWAQSDLDRFLLAKLEGAKLRPSAPAEARTLLRRMTFDLTGLPPTAEEVTAFETAVSRDRPVALSAALDRLLASPHYGERWGRYWLDIARYADTKGYVFQEERRYGFAYTYRDWVIKAFNDDLPYDQFLIQQIAADRVVKDGDNRPLAALGFLTLGRRFLNNQQEIIDDRIDVLTRGTMGLTVSCARCHDHKFDPVSQKDYYALYGVFASSVEPKELPLLPADNDPETVAKYRAEREKIDAELVRFTSERCGEIARSIMLVTGVPVVLPALPREVAKNLFNRADRDKAREITNKFDALDAGPLAPPRAMVLNDGPLVDPHVFKRGNPGMPGDAVPRRFISMLAGGNPLPFKDGSGRLELAQAIASKENPLTARVFVNRLWAYHFGKGLVRTPGDFGVRGDAPTHPELLDWLAARFVAEGWSVKKLHRLMMLSAAYQQGSDENPQATIADPENLLVWRMNRRRLDFESTRDSLLRVAGKLETNLGGRPVDITRQPFTHRRSVYSYIDRQNLPGVFRTFDFASPDTTSPQRFITTVPQQALFMMNSPFVIEQARALVAQPQFKQEQAYEEQVQELYGRVFARRAEAAEVDAALRFLAEQRTPPEPEAPAAPLWQYGYGGWNEAAKRVDFQPLPHFENGTWQGGRKVPDPKLGWVLLNATGGHAGGDAQHCAIRRWIAPRAGTVVISGTVRRAAEAGDGVLARVISSRLGKLLKIEVGPKASVEAALSVEVQPGDTLDFLIDCRAGENSDSFEWAPVLRVEGAEWNAREQFAGPPPPRPAGLSPWEKYAQVLLQANEFVFVD